MLEIGSKTITIDGVTVFSDHADPDQFWYLPGPVQMARRKPDNRAAFTFIKYGNVDGNAIKGRGFLMVEVNLKLDANIERKIISRISSMAKGTPKLAAVPFDDGTVECIALDLQGGGGTVAQVAADGSFRAVENILGGAVPSLHGDNSAAFSLSLTGEGATIIEDVFKKKGTPVGAVYHLKYSGLTPALEVEIKANLKRVYDHFSAGLEAQVYFVRAGIDAGFEKLVQDGVIEIKVINFSTADDKNSKEEWALNFFKENLLTEWFRPTLTPGQLAGGIAQAENLDAVQKRAQAMKPKPTPEPPVPARTVAPASGGTPAAEGTPASGGTPTPATPRAPRPDAGTGTPETTSVVPNPPVQTGNAATHAETATAMPPAAPAPPAVPDVSAPRLPNPANMAPDTALVSFKLKMIKQIEEKTLTFKFTRAEAVQRTYSPQGFFGLFAEDLNKEGHFFQVDGDDPFFREFRVSVESPFDKEKIDLASAHVQMNYGKPGTDKKHKDFIIDKDSPAKLEWLVKTIPGVNTYGYTVQYHFKPDSEWKSEKSSYEFPEKVTEDRTLLVHPFDNLVFLDVNISASNIDWTQVAEVSAQLTYKAENGWTQQDTFFFTAANPGDQQWKIRSSDINNKSYSYSVFYKMINGNTYNVEVPKTGITQIAIVNPLKAISIEFIPLYTPNVFKTIFIDINYTDEENNLKIKDRLKLDGNSTDSVKYLLHVIDDTKGSYTYQTTFVGADNSLKRNEPIETQETLIALSN
ncbi:MAG: hypothetical protein PHV53_02690 [Fermentimonas sp.]|nr:hypothetical protein [Fermentimonas sp.]